jgi:hypothetical protein
MLSLDSQKPKDKKSYNLLILSARQSEDTRVLLRKFRGKSFDLFKQWRVLVHTDAMK